MSEERTGRAHHIAFYGSLETGEGQAVAEAMRAWLGDRWAVKPRDLGLELVHDDEAAGRYVYCHFAGSDGTTRPFYLLEGSTKEPTGAARPRLLRLVRLLADRGIDCSLDYTVEDEDGRALSEEVTLDRRSLPLGGPMTDEALVEAYRTTVYALFRSGEALREVRIGEKHPELGGAWAFLTAYNPGHEKPGEAANEAAQARLRREIEALGLVPERAEGTGVDGYGEPMVFVAGLPREAAERLGKAFRQWGIVVAGAGAEAELVLLPHTS